MTTGGEGEGERRKVVNYFLIEPVKFSKDHSARN